MKIHRQMSENSKHSLIDFLKRILQVLFLFLFLLFPCIFFCICLASYASRKSSENVKGVMKLRRKETIYLIYKLFWLIAKWKKKWFFFKMNGFFPNPPMTEIKCAVFRYSVIPRRDIGLKHFSWSWWSQGQCISNLRVLMISTPMHQD